MASQQDRDNANAIVTVVDKSGQVHIKHELLKNIPVDIPLDERALARAGTSRGCTLNMGNYESVKIDAWLTIPCHLGQVDAAYEYAADWAESRVREEVGKVRSGK